MGFTQPRPIQEQALPAALAGGDVLGLAQTGTGKTAAFALPILQRLLGARRRGPRALVVAPTRELASQVHAEIERLAQHTAIKAVAIFGGVPLPRQIRALARFPDIIVACPGRLLDLLSQGALRLDGIEVLVLDEADHMFDMGFLPDLRRILRALPARRQNLLFSATMPSEIRRLADAILNKPVVVELANARPAETIEHSIYPLAEGDKVGALERLLGGDDFRSAIVFLRTKRRAKKLAERLDSRGHAAVALQGNMSQPQRERALSGFREGRYDVLVATDIAARGLDIAGVSHVVNFDVPNTPDAYTHRIGRTGRSEQTGIAFTFVTPTDGDAVRAIEKRLGAPIERRKAAELGPIERSALQETKARGGRERSPAGRTRTTSPRSAATTATFGASKPKKAAKVGKSTQRALRFQQAKQARPAEVVESSPFGVGVLEAPAVGRSLRKEARSAPRPVVRSEAGPPRRARRRRRGA